MFWYYTKGIKIKMLYVEAAQLDCLILILQKDIEHLLHASVKKKIINSIEGLIFKIISTIKPGEELSLV